MHAGFACWWTWCITIGGRLILSFTASTSAQRLASTFTRIRFPGFAARPGVTAQTTRSTVRSFIIDNFHLWQDEYHVDGFRWDAVGAMRHYDPGYVSIPEADSLIQYINANIIAANSISIAEDDSFGMGFDGEWDRGFGDLLIQQVTKTNDADRDMNALSAGMSGSGFARVFYSETHDLVGDLNGPTAQRLPKRIDSTTPTSYAARKRSMLAAAVVLTSPALPMLFMGQEMLTVDQF